MNREGVELCGGGQITASNSFAMNLTVQGKNILKGLLQTRPNYSTPLNSAGDIK